jgi:hypothetical protein
MRPSSSSAPLLRLSYSLSLSALVMLGSMMRLTAEDLYMVMQGFMCCMVDCMRGSVDGKVNYGYLQLYSLAVGRCFLSTMI